MRRLASGLVNKGVTKQKKQTVSPTQKIHANWFNHADNYWNKQPATYDGMLGGHENLHQIDIQHSKDFLLKSVRGRTRTNTALDCGAGIGRITEALLTHHYQKIDLMDQSIKMMETAKTRLQGNPKIHKLYVVGMQNFEFRYKYDCIWIQWALCQLPDDYAVTFLKKASQNLNPHGMIILKENEGTQQYKLDKEDYSLIRSQSSHGRLFLGAEVRVVRREQQRQWPDDLCKVAMYCLKPI